MSADQFVPLSKLLSTLRAVPFFPLEHLAAAEEDEAFLNNVGVTEVTARDELGRTTWRIVLAVTSEVSFDLPLLAGAQVVLWQGGAYTELPLEIDVDTTGSEPRFLSTLR